MGNTTVNPTQCVKFFYLQMKNFFYLFFFYFLELAYDRTAAIDTEVDDTSSGGHVRQPITAMNGLLTANLRPAVIQRFQPPKGTVASY